MNPDIPSYSELRAEYLAYGDAVEQLVNNTCRDENGKLIELKVIAAMYAFLDMSVTILAQFATETPDRKLVEKTREEVIRMIAKRFEVGLIPLPPETDCN